MSRLATQIGMMEEILKLQSRIRAKKEKERALKTSRNEKYTTMLEPVTQQLERMKPLPPPPPQTSPGVPDVKEEQDLIDFTDPAVHHEEVKDHSLFDKALTTVTASRRDDGVFGLDLHKNRIGAHGFQIDGNNLVIDEGEYVYNIGSRDLWRLLLVKNPESIQLKVVKKGKYQPFVKEYLKIVRDLRLMDFAYAKLGERAKFRAKYQLIKSIEKEGSGFMFSVRPPPFTTGKRVKPSTVVIPSDKKGLLRALVKAVAELRAGNTSMRNLVVPLAQEAKRKKILPRHLLSADEKTWVFA